MTSERSEAATVSKGENSDQQVDQGRRTFVIATVAAAAACACCGTGAAFGQKQQRPKVEPGPVDVGKLDDFAKDGVNTNFVKSKEVLVIRNEGKLYASSAVCTHRGCLLEMKGSVITCPCHKSTFSNFGTVTGGQAKESLVRYAIAVKDDKVIVDTAKTFREKSWEEPASFVEIKKA